MLTQKKKKLTIQQCYCQHWPLSNISSSQAGNWRHQLQFLHPPLESEFCLHRRWNFNERGGKMHSSITKQKLTHHHTGKGKQLVTSRTLPTSNPRSCPVTKAGENSLQCLIIFKITCFYFCVKTQKIYIY